MHDATAIPEHLKDQAEAVRAHLVHLRGGAPFLSPADALCLVGWLDAQVSVRAILLALDRAVEARRKRPARRPLSLGAAKAHLGKPPLTPTPFGRSTDGAAERGSGGGHPFEPVRDALSAMPDPDAHTLARALASLPADAPDALVPAAVAVCRDHLEARWSAIPVEARERRIADAAHSLGDLANLVDADTLRALSEEIARDAFRQAPSDGPWPRLDTATFTALAGL